MSKSVKSQEILFSLHTNLLKGVKDFKMETKFGGLQKEISKGKKGFLFNISHLRFKACENLPRGLRKVRTFFTF